MNAYGIKDQEKIRKDRAKKAIALAMRSRWDEAVKVNRSILKDFPDDLEAYNRLGKAHSELGQNREAAYAFQRALAISPGNSIAKKNLDRLSRLGDEAPRGGARSHTAPPVFIEESGKAGVTSLVNPASAQELLRLAPGHAVQLEIDRGGITVAALSGEYLGQVEPRLASRLIRFIKGGNKYEATVTSVAENALSVIIREVYKHPSQVGTVSFPSKGGVERQVYLQSALLDSDLTEEESQKVEPVVVKDWSNDDTEPGDDDAYSPVFHRIINAGNDAATEGTEEEEDL